MDQSKEPRKPEERHEPGPPVLGDYELIRKLGRGGFSTVYLARHRLLSRWSTVALKRLQTPLDTAEAREQFRAEVRLLERLSHSHILPLLDAGIDQQDCPYLVTPYAEGGSLRQHLRSAAGHPLPLSESLQILAQIGAALQYAHERGIIHRDLKPENILFAIDGTALLADFGLALQLGSRSLEAASISGTPAYMAPEQFRGQVGRESDQYALACIAYELCTGRRLFEHHDPVTLMYWHTQREPQPPRHFNPALPPALEAAILRGLAKERQERYPSVNDFITALLSGAPAGPAPARPRVSPWKGAIWGEDENREAAQASEDQQPEPLAQFPTSRLAAHEEEVEVEAEELATPPPPTSGSEQQRSWQRFPHLRRSQIQRRQQRERQESRAGPEPTGVPLRERASLAALTPPPLMLPRSPNAVEQVATRHLPPPEQPPGKRGGRRPAARWSRLLLSTVALLVLLLASGLVMAYSDPAALGPLGTILPIGAPLATVHIRPTSVLLTRQYLITGVTGRPDPAQRQIQARRLSVTVSSPAKTVPATGHGVIAGTQAHGTITFYNGTGLAQTVPKGTILAVREGISIVTDDTASMPPSPDLDHRATSTVPAHVLQPGSIGNLPAGALNQYCCNEALAIQAINGPFTGGQDPQPYTYVQQSDLDNVVNPLKAGLLQQAQQQFQQQVHSGERVVGPDCSTSTRSNHHVGDHATSVTVSLAVTCSGAAYTPQAALDLATALLRQEAARDPGPAYALAGQISSSIIDTSLSDPQSGRLIITVKAQGRWTYRFTEGTQQRLVQLIVGKSRSQALQLLQRQPGVNQANISIVRSDGDRLPSNPVFIAIIIENST
ncbi:serine/threonine-protein kinase [Thermogemmatispora carboxidivorans]|uniref:serine/threonine-protein kinase n=1 Tax=Thermogemmatispora carboxidivorans TaxID=1382306 RepID=UPI00069C69E7|nr:serine/threonine-protein kinase [Thermogemmatispora carboxidivorans]